MCGRIGSMFLLGMLGAVVFAASMVSFAKFAKAFGDGTFENRDPRTDRAACRSH